jgi:hypothetical protein
VSPPGSDERCDHECHPDHEAKQGYARGKWAPANELAKHHCASGNIGDIAQRFGKECALLRTPS